MDTLGSILRNAANKAEAEAAALPKLTIYKRNTAERIYWEVVLYQKPRHLVCYSQAFKRLSDAMHYARLHTENPKFSEIVVHSIIASFHPGHVVG